MTRVAGVLALVLVVSLLGASDVRGAGALAPAGKTTGPALTATIVIDVTGGVGTAGKGLTSIRVQKAGSSAAVLFETSYIRDSQFSCFLPNSDLAGSTNARFAGFLMDGWVAPASVLQALVGQFGNPNKAAITDTDYVACTGVDRGDGTGVRQILSFTAVIQFQP